MHRNKEGKLDFGSTTAVNIIWEKAKERLTPKIMWGIVVAITLAVGFVVNLQHNSSSMEKTTIQLQAQFNILKQQLDDAAKDRADDRAKLAAIEQSVKDIANEMDEQRRWRDHVEGVAESFPHARKRR